MDVTYKQEIGVGAAVLAGFLIFVASMFWLTGRTFSKGEASVDVVFANVSGLKQGDAVLISGVKKGQVAKVNLERRGRVTVTLSLDGGVEPKIDASAAVMSLDFFGAKFIDFNPGVQEQSLPKGTAIVGTSPPDLATVATGLGQRADELLTNASAIVSPELAVDLRNTMVALQRTLNVITTAGSGPLLKQTTVTLERTGSVLARLDSILASSTGRRIDTLSANITILTHHLGNATARLDTLLGGINSGGGTLSMMANDTALYHNLNRTLASLTALMNDLKERPGRYLTVKVF